jgi:hypothetical protein
MQIPRAERREGIAASSSRSEASATARPKAPPRSGDSAGGLDAKTKK